MSSLARRTIEPAEDEHAEALHFVAARHGFAVLDRAGRFELFKLPAAPVATFPPRVAAFPEAGSGGKKKPYGANVLVSWA